MIHNMILAALTIGIAPSGIPTNFEATKGMRKPNAMQTLDRYFSFLDPTAIPPLNRFKTHSLSVCPLLVQDLTCCFFKFMYINWIKNWPNMSKLK